MATSLEPVGMRNFGRQWLVNTLCILGACIGIAAVFFTWIYIPLTMPEPAPIHPSHTPTILFMVSGHHYPPSIGDLYISASVIFLLGSVIAFVLPIGGLFQLASMAMFAYGIIESAFRSPLDGINQQQLPGPGMLLGIASMVMIFLSMFRRLEKGRMQLVPSGKGGLKKRFLTVNFMRSA